MSRVLKSPAQIVRAVFNDLVATFFPADCRVCGGPLTSAGHSPLCEICIDALREQSSELCARCCEALDLDGVRFRLQAGGEGAFCSPCRMTPPEFERAAAWGVYTEGMRDAIRLLKYERAEAIARPLGLLLAKVMKTMAQQGMGRDVTVIAVPLHPRKQRQRGYNQSVLLADEAVRSVRAEGWPLEVQHAAMMRTRPTDSQFGLSPRERRRNLRGAFVVRDPQAVSGHEVLLVDDIYTTGATARECARVLRQAGATKVWVATVARAQKETVALWGAPSGASLRGEVELAAR
ncbi:MAG TPA: ComF family protein [Edaphobacter sp.]|nr:ComF family protein [Edaphobacter sp.]